MKIYLVGGAVRDKLLGRAVTEKDWVVVGSTPEEMLKLGYRPVGKDFPVFLHPNTNEEYALARTERSTGRGYTNFAFYSAPDVSLEDDLRRRDLTINAIAQDPETGKIIDPYHGQEDIKNKLLRHVSPAFIEDPVRILRIARFAARYYNIGFKVAPETMELMREMVRNGEVDALVPERVWQEFEYALSEIEPREFFRVLNQCSALEKLFPEFLPHLNNLDLSIDNDALIRFATFARVFTESEIQSLSHRYRFPNTYQQLALIVIRYQNIFKQNKKLNAEEIMQLFDQTDAWRRPHRFELFLKICANQDQQILLRLALNKAKKVSSKELIKKNVTGKELGIALRKQRLHEIKKLMHKFY